MRILKTLRNLAFTLSVAGALVACGSSNPSDSNNNSNNGQDNVAAEKQQVVNLYYDWANYSQQHNYSGMMGLVAQGSNFAGASRVCKSNWDNGLEYFFSFNSVEVDLIDGNEAYVWGNWVNYAGTPLSSVEDGFYSGPIKINGVWKLSGMNWDCKKNWWR